ncbi:hypothetical protein JAO76_15590 [Pontibacter sp. BT310]|uniref:Uncharacterized protein n=1 Tax=Pontibacter populi TaxID=890055 RepID=A0ABS6XH91_9BACT|nr:MULTISPECIES: hypothetical protein [Pontibacter]MBJ6119633.1 hypothetical protein [Pontibacter sp. BT310]MBR0572060.1 hypothetical protein [Microvirga sp. STS03]MBW3366486.1 hypothetical protein [Pontibacter populi]
MQNYSTRLPSPKYLTAQSLFLEVNANRDKRLETYKSKQNYNKTYANQLAQELDADLSFYCESQREVDRLLDHINALKLQLVAQAMAAKLDQSIIQDFIKSKKLDVEMLGFYIEHFKSKLNTPTTPVN